MLTVFVVLCLLCLCLCACSVSDEAKELCGDIHDDKGDVLIRLPPISKEERQVTQDDWSETENFTLSTLPKFDVHGEDDPWSRLTNATADAADLSASSTSAAAADSIAAALSFTAVDPSRPFDDAPLSTATTDATAAVVSDAGSSASAAYAAVVAAAVSSSHAPNLASDVLSYASRKRKPATLDDPFGVWDADGGEGEGEDDLFDRPPPSPGNNSIIPPIGPHAQHAQLAPQNPKPHAFSYSLPKSGTPHHTSHLLAFFSQVFMPCVCMRRGQGWFFELWAVCFDIVVIICGGGSGSIIVGQETYYGEIARENI